MTVLPQQYAPSSFSLLFLVLLMVQHLPASNANNNPTASSTNYRWFCDLTLNPVVTLEWDASIRGYVVQRDDDAEDLRDPLSGWTRRLLGSWFGSGEGDDYGSNLRSNSNLPEFMREEAALLGGDDRALRLQENQPTLGDAVILDTNQVPTTPAQTVEARACDCWNSMVWGGAFYCTMPRTHCAIPSSPIGLPGCVDVQKQRRIVRSIWPVLVVWYASVLFCLSFTLTGRHALSCCIATIYPGWNRATADRLLRNDPNQANQMLLRHYRIMRARYERRLMRRLRRRARRDSQRARERRRQAESGVNPLPPPPEDDSQSSDLEEEMPFPNLWDLAIIPRPAATSTGDPQPTTLTLKTRIYKQVGKKKDQEEKEKEQELVPLMQKEEEGEEDELNTGNKQEEEGKEAENDNETCDPECMLVPSCGSLATTELDTNSEATGDIVIQHNPSEDDTDADTALAVVVKTDKADAEGADNDAPPPTNKDANDLSEWDDNCCTICYGELEDGDRVGALPCGHVFHVDPCLKHWLTRRNVCPLCLAEDIATPNFTYPAGGTSNSGLSFVVAPPMDDSTSDQERSTPRDEQDNNSILEENENDPNVIPAFAPASTTGPTRPRSRIIEMTSIFTRRRRNNATAANTGSQRSAEQFSNEDGNAP